MVYVEFKAGWINEVVGNVCNYKPPKYVIYEILEHTWSAKELILHDQIFIEPASGAECRLPLVPLSDSE